MTPEAIDNLIFHYNLRFYDGDETEVNGMNLKRFVMQSMVDDAVSSTIGELEIVR